MNNEFPFTYVRSERQIRERRSWIIAGLIALALLTCFAFPMALLQGCSDDDYRKAVRASAAIGTSLVEVQALNEQAYAAAFIDRQEAVAIAKGVREAALVNDHFVHGLRQYGALNKRSKAELVRMVADVAREIGKLRDEGILRVKNPSARVKFAAAIAGAVTALNVLAELIGRYEPDAAPSTNIHVSELPHKREPMAVAHEGDAVHTTRGEWTFDDEQTAAHLNGVAGLNIEQFDIIEPGSVEHGDQAGRRGGAAHPDPRA